MTHTLEQGREAFERKAWGNAYAEFVVADAEGPLEVDDLERLAIAAYLTGREEESFEAWTRAYHARLDAGERSRAARCAFWLGLKLMFRGEQGRSSGWFSRAQELVEGEDECAEQGLLLTPTGLGQLGSGEHEAAMETFVRLEAIGKRTGDRDAATLGRLGQGQTLLRQGRTGAGGAKLDEAMVAVTASEVSPMVAGIVYCAALEACQDVFDLGRAHEWTEAMTQWCAAQPDLVPYRGECLIHRAEVMQLRGAWPEAVDEAKRAGELLVGRPPQASAFYQQAEMHRLRGELDEAEEAYRQASRAGRLPEPGLALLRLAQGRTDAALASIRRAADEVQGAAARSRVLPACVEISLAAGEIEAARAAAEELSQAADELDAPYLHAVSAQATGAVLLAEGEAQQALASLRQAWTAWQELEAPYEGARVRVLVGLACRELGDEDSAEMELDAARWVFDELGAGPDLARVDALSRKTAGDSTGLTKREVQVLRHVAAGKTNRAIADELVLSEKTVARHISNIFGKLSVSSRAAATAYAYEHDLV